MVLTGGGGNGAIVLRYCPITQLTSIDLSQFLNFQLEVTQFVTLIKLEICN